MDLQYRFATDTDVDTLAEWNRMLLQDENHRNASKTLEFLRERMRGFLAGEYKAILFTLSGDPIAYALYRESEDEIYLRQFFVRRDRRREGIGRKAMDILFRSIWPRDKRLTLEVLCQNETGIRFWRSVGYRDYCLTMEIRREPAAGS